MLPHSCFIIMINCHRGWLSFHLFSCTCAYTAEGTSNTRLIFPQPIQFGRDSSPVRHMKCSGFSLFSVWHTIKLYLEEIQCFYKHCISINCVLPLSLPYLCSKGENTAWLPNPLPFEHYFPSVHVSTFETALSMKNSTAKKQGCLTILYSLNFSEKSSRQSFNVKAILASF